MVGYAGGAKKNPTYHNLGDHTETVELEYDPDATTYEKLLEVFWTHHDPTEYHKRQYISAIFYYDDEQKLAAEISMERSQKRFHSPILTEILSIGHFYEAEDYHQKYLLKHQAPSVFKSLKLTPEQVLTSSIAAKLNGYVGGYGSVEQFEKDSANWGLSDEQADVVRRKIPSTCTSSACGL